MTQVDHMEVAPRMWDKSLAASYIPKEQLSPEQPQGSDSQDMSPVVVAGNAIGIFDKLKMYIVPALLILGIIISLYVLWKYFTIYRNNKATKSNTDVICENDIKPKPETIDPQLLVKTEDLSKYEFDSDNEESSDDEEEPSRLPQIQELSDESSEEDSGSEEDGSDEDSASEEEEDSSEESEDEEQKESAPDISEIEQLIKDSKFAEGSDIAMLEEDEEDMFELPAPAKKPKRLPKKPSRITL